MKKILLAAIAALVLAGCGDGAKDVSKDFIGAVYEGKSDKALSYLDFSEAKDDGLKEMMSGKLKAAISETKNKAEKLGGVDGIEVISSDEKDDTANVELEVKFKDGSKRSERVKLKKVNGDWKIRL